MPVQNCLVGQLLRYAASPEGLRDGLTHWELSDVDQRQLEWALLGGLGPLLHYATRERPEVVPVSWRERLMSEALTARMRYAERIEVACEVIELCAQAGVPATLLKGISTSEQFYPAAHLRPMGDIDILVPLQSHKRIQAALVDAGYQSAENYPDGEGQNHGPPLHHPRRDVWIEIHRRLFRLSDELSAADVFGAANLEANSEAFTYHGLHTRRLRREMHLLYTASSWMRDLNRMGIHPSFLVSIFDAFFLFRRNSATFDWNGLLSHLGNDMHTAAFHVLLSYLDSRYGLELPADITKVLARRQALVGGLQMRIIHAVLDRYLIAGRRWTYRMPPPFAGRYSVRRYSAKLRNLRTADAHR